MLSQTVINRDHLRQKDTFAFKSLDIVKERIVRAILAEDEGDVDFDDLVEASAKQGGDVAAIKQIVVEEVFCAVASGEFVIPEVFRPW
ncbi:hypothetical protein JKY72_02985 [Candidatus Gracilibacteria bacterium]|nr:hypothetical protein [Candidatus Gracilibacteria bacterium]